ncbi:hypothetical protein [Rhodococcus artemisiae]|uniref:Uncharacterized protein n=1 Tax=Rhodococcus artemisiae TaxID=714159 RepID=A0ABU7LJN5_9NOCA|nr:hypothetical protein [Rhodococcus artemisiae]MEE2061773.1 hypothetical protein [Rhodococcus artemisiae]
MGIRHLSLDLPFDLPAVDAVAMAGTELRSRAVAGWTQLHLHAVSPTTTAGISTYLFTYWLPNDPREGPAETPSDPEPDLS